MATPENWDQFNEDMRRWQELAEDMALKYQGLVNVADSGQLAALAFIADLSSAPVGDRAELLSRLGLSGAYTKTNILGTVSQSSGVPAGAIIERGGNSDGEYVKFADGTMICTTVIRTVGATIGRGNVFWGESAIYSWPVRFTAIPLTTSYCTSTVNGWGGAALNEGLADYRMRLFSASPLSSVSGKIVAIGPWY